ncbi:MAG: hypothetical protein GTO18_06045 [Anaerolineales bacterium]|nr:hypothetical protein [Anaerolineales bacterium]
MTPLHSRLKPAMPRWTLMLFSGLMWSVVGILLIRLALSWYLKLGIQDHAIFMIAGAILALLIHFLGFSKLAFRNAARIQNLPPKPCVFAFMAWWNYPLVLFMISLGIMMRNSFIPKSFLGVLYIGIGGGLFLSGLHYYRFLERREPQVTP